MVHLVFKKVTTPEEAENLRKIRNQCRTYMTRNTEEISASQQQEWFKTIEGKYEPYIAYAVEHGVIVVDAGYGLIHLNQEQCMVSGGLLPDYRDKGLGSVLFKFLVDCCSKQLPVRLEVLKTNIRALKTYEKIGFRQIGENELIYFMEYNNDK